MSSAEDQYLSVEEQEFLEEWSQVAVNSSPRGKSTEEKLRILAQAYADAREKGEDPSKALREKYKELNHQAEAEE
jgi:predicted YcjX-like family ATPase